MAGRLPQGPLTSLACWALTGSAYCSSAWNWLFLVKVMIFRTVPNLEKICGRTIVSLTQQPDHPPHSEGPVRPPHLVQHVQGHRVEEVLYNDPEHRALAGHCHSCIYCCSRGSQGQIS